MNDDDAFRDLAAALFGKPGSLTVPDIEEEPPKANVVPTEGKTPPTPPRDEMRDFTRDLFGYTD